MRRILTVKMPDLPTVAAWHICTARRRPCIVHLVGIVSTYHRSVDGARSHIHSGCSSSHFCLLALQRLQPVKDRDIEGGGGNALKESLLVC
jgi:hypothetical protein